MDIIDLLKQPIIWLVIVVIIPILVNIISNFLQTFLYERPFPSIGYIDYGDKEEISKRTYVLRGCHKALKLYWNRFGMSFPIPNGFFVTDVNYSSVQEPESISLSRREIAEDREIRKEEYYTVEVSRWAALIAFILRRPTMENVKLRGGFFRINAPEEIEIEYRRVLPRERILQRISGYDQPDRLQLGNNRLRMKYTIQNNWRKEVKHFELALTDYPSEDFVIENFRVRSEHGDIDTDLRDVIRVHEIPFDVYIEQRDARGSVEYEWRFSLPEGETTVEFDYRWEEEGQ